MHVSRELFLQERDLVNGADGTLFFRAEMSFPSGNRP
jgi:hypothetical protein